MKTNATATKYTLYREKMRKTRAVQNDAKNLAQAKEMSTDERWEMAKAEFEASGAKASLTELGWIILEIFGFFTLIAIALGVFPR